MHPRSREGVQAPPEGRRMTAPEITDDDRRIAHLLDSTDVYRVNPKSGVVHTCDCRTQLPEMRPEVLPWPEFRDYDDKPCSICKPNLEATR
jgi:hypothetical protein